MLEPGWTQHLLTAGASTAARIARLCELCRDGLDSPPVSLQLVADGPYRVTCTPPAGRRPTRRPAAGTRRGTRGRRGPDPGAGAGADLRAGGDARWPWFAPAAVGLGIGAVFALPVQVGATTTGVLGLCRHRRPAA